jgi:collagenase-like PrtC family protease
MDIFKHEKYKFRNCEIGAIYGAPHGAIWNGGRARGASYPDIDNVKDWSVGENVNCALTFTNCLLTEEHLDNLFCNEITRRFEREENAIIVESPLLEEYIRKNYPKYKIVSSTTKCIRSIDLLKEELEKPYERVVLDYNFNKNFDVLKSLEHKEKCELLVNAVCYPDCPRRREHYEYISADVLRLAQPGPFICDAMTKPLYQALENTNTITVDAIFNVYNPLGYQHFKIEGRTANIEDLIEILVYYTVKPEYQLEIRQRLNLIL